MRAPTLILLVIVFLGILATGCSSKTEVKYITGYVISKPEPEVTLEPPAQEEPQMHVYDDIVVQDSGDIVVDNEKPIISTKTMAQKNIIGTMACDEDKINLGYKTCYNTTEGKVRIFLKNSGYDQIPGLWFNIEVNEESHYESTDVGLLDDGFVEYILDIPAWQDKYKDADRIVMIPLAKTSEGNKLCMNRALLLEPHQSCTKYLYE